VPQQLIGNSSSRFNIAAWGRQSGKTTHGITKALYKPLQGRQGGVYWFIGQTNDAARIAFNRYLNFAKPFIFAINRSTHEAKLKNGATIFFKSGWNFEDLRMETLDGVIIDEYRQQHPELWPKIIRPMLTRRSGWADFLSTTNGFEHFYDLFNQAKDNPKEWSTFHAPSSSAWWWTDDELKSTRSTMSEDEYAQEIDAEFREMGKGKVYKNHSVDNQLLNNPFARTGDLWSPYLPIVIGLDFNVGQMCWELGQFKGEDFYFGDEISMKNTDTQEMCPLLIDKVKGHPPGVVIIGDATGKSRKTSAAGQTDYSIIMKALKEAGIPCKNLTPESNGLVKDRVNIVNGRLRAADGSVHLWYHPKNCKMLKKDLERVVWKGDSGEAILDKTKDPTLTHSSDAFGYPIVHYSPEWRQKPNLMRIIER
jgi:hypothetical protein